SGPLIERFYTIMFWQPRPSLFFPQPARRGWRRMELRRPEYRFRYSRTRYGRRSEWNGRTWGCAALQRDIPDVFRLHETGHPAGGVERSQSDLHIYARQHRTWGGWRHAPTY